MNQVRYIHIRNFTENNEVSGKGGATIAFREINDRIEYAIALCHIKDNYRKSYGRDKASGRLNSPSHRKIFNGTREQFYDSLDNQSIHV